MGEEDSRFYKPLKFITSHPEPVIYTPPSDLLQSPHLSPTNHLVIQMRNQTSPIPPSPSSPQPIHPPGPGSHFLNISEPAPSLPKISAQGKALPVLNGKALGRPPRPQCTPPHPSFQFFLCSHRAPIIYEWDHAIFLLKTFHGLHCPKDYTQACNDTLLLSWVLLLPPPLCILPLPHPRGFAMPFLLPQAPSPPSFFST